MEMPKYTNIQAEVNEVAEIMLYTEENKARKTMTRKMSQTVGCDFSAWMPWLVCQIYVS